MLWQMRAEEEGLDPVEAQDAVLRDNLFGLELDPRCVQIAMFAVALQAWKAGGGWRQLPVPNIACSGIPVKAPVEEWKALAGGDAAARERARPAAHPVPRRRHARQPDRPETGDRDHRPDRAAAVVRGRRLGRDRARCSSRPLRPRPTIRPPPCSAPTPPASREPPTTSRATTPSSPPTSPTSDASKQSTIAATTSASRILAMAQRTWRRCSAALRELGRDGGRRRCVSPQNWLFLSSYRAFRERCPRHDSAGSARRVSAPGAFGAISWRGRAACALIVIDATVPTARSHSLRSTCRRAADASDEGRRARQRRARTAIDQARQLANPDARIVARTSRTRTLAREATRAASSGHHDRRRRHDSARSSGRSPTLVTRWESASRARRRDDCRSAALERSCCWEDGDGRSARRSQQAPRSQGQRRWGQRGRCSSARWAICRARSTRASCSTATCAVIVPNDRSGSCRRSGRSAQSAEFATSCPCDRHEARRSRNATLVKVPFDVEHWRQVAEEQSGRLAGAVVG